MTTSPSKHVNHCRACQAEIVFLKTEKAFMPCDAASVTDQDTHYEHGRHVSHYATCASPGQFRRRQHTHNPESTPR